MLSVKSADEKEEAEEAEEAEGDEEEDEKGVAGAENTISDKILRVWDPTISDLW